MEGAAHDGHWRDDGPGKFQQDVHGDHEGAGAEPAVVPHHRVHGLHLRHELPVLSRVLG